MTTKRYRKVNKNNYVTFDDLEQYGLGSWLKKNAGTIGTVAGMGAGLLLAPATGGASLLAAGALGSSIGGSIGGAVQKNEEMKEATEAQNKMVDVQNRTSQNQSLLQQSLNQNPLQSFAPTMKRGGKIPSMANGGTPPKKYYINTPSGRMSINPEELEEVKTYLGIEKEMRDAYSKKYPSRIKEFSSASNPLQKYAQDIAKDPSKIIPSENYYEDYKKKYPEKYPIFEKWRNKFIPSDLSGGTKENIDNTTEGQYAYRNMILSSQLGDIEEVEETEPIPTTTPVSKNISWDPYKGYPNISIGYESVGGKRTPTTFRNAQGKEVPINPKLGMVPSSYPELNADFQNIEQKEFGGTINYNGQYHEGPNGGVPVDEMGNFNPIKPSALVEKGEVGYNTKDGGTYVFSDSLLLDKNKTFAGKSKSIQNKYKMRMKDGKINDPISKRGYELEMNSLMEQQEAHRTMNGMNEENTEGLPEGKSGIYIKPSKKGTFTAAASKHGKGVQEFARQVLANKDNYSPAMVKKANFARNAAKWNKEYGGNLPTYEDGSYLKPIIPNPTGVIVPSAQQMRTDLGLTSPTTPTTQSVQPYQGMSITEAALPAIASAASNIFLANRAKRYTPRKLNLSPMVARTLNLEGERAGLREQGNVARAMNKRALMESGASAGQFMSNVGASNVGVQRALGEQLGRSYQTEAMTNLQSQQQVDQINAEREMQEQMYNSQLEANKNAQVDQYYMNALSTIPMAMKDYYQSQKDAERLSMMQPNVGMYTTRRNRYWGLGGNKFKRENS